MAAEHRPSMAQKNIGGTITNYTYNGLGRISAAIATIQHMVASLRAQHLERVQKRRTDVYGLVFVEDHLLRKEAI